MSKTTKKRFVTKQIEMEMVLPEPYDLIAKITGSRGSYLLEVIDENGENYLVSMPVKYRNTVWVKRGNFVIIEPIEEGNKVKAEIKHVIDNENILYIRAQGCWPAAFNSEAEMMTRTAKRGNVAESSGIDADMLPPNDSDEDDDVDDDDGSKEENDDETDSMASENLNENVTNVCD